MNLPGSDQPITINREREKAGHRTEARFVMRRACAEVHLQLSGWRKYPCAPTLAGLVSICPLPNPQQRFAFDRFDLDGVVAFFLSTLLDCELLGSRGSPRSEISPIIPPHRQIPSS